MQVSSISTVDSIATELIDLPLLFPWFTNLIERGAAARAGCEASLVASIDEGNQDNALGTTIRYSPIIELIFGFLMVFILS